MQITVTKITEKTNDDGSKYWEVYAGEKRYYIRGENAHLVRVFEEGHTYEVETQPSSTGKSILITSAKPITQVAEANKGITTIVESKKDTSQDLRIKCLELAVQYVHDHPDYKYADVMIFATLFESYIKTGKVEEKNAK